MKCEDAGGFTQDYLEGTLSETARKIVGTHLATCERCSNDSRWMGGLHKLMKGEPVVEAPAGLVDRVHKQVFPKGTPSFRTEFLRLAAAAGILIATAFAALGSASDPGGVTVEVGWVRNVDRAFLDLVDRTVDRMNDIYLNATEDDQ